LFGAAKIGFNACFEVENREFFEGDSECFVKELGLREALWARGSSVH
jgi:hypothetical protein